MQWRGRYRLLRQFRYLFIVIEVGEFAKVTDGSGLLEQNLRTVSDCNTAAEMQTQLKKLSINSHFAS